MHNIFEAHLQENVQKLSMLYKIFTSNAYFLSKMLYLVLTDYRQRTSIIIFAKST